MKKIAYAFTLLFFFASECFSQNGGYISFSYGASVPFFNFDSKSVTSYLDPVGSGAAGYANTGKMFELAFAYKKPEKHIGFSFIYRNQKNEPDMQILKEDLLDYMNSPDIVITTEAKSWQTNAMMIGGYIEIPIVKKLAWDFRAMLGGVSVSSPDWEITMRASNGFYYHRQHLGSAFSFGYITGTGFKYDIMQGLCLMANVDLFAAFPEFTAIQYYNSSQPTFTTFTQYITTYNFSAGIGFRL